MNRDPAVQMADVSLVNEVLACTDFETLAAQLLPRLGAFFRAGSSCAFEMHRDGERLHLGRAAQLHMPPRSIADYSAHFVGLDPVCAPAFEAPGQHGLAPNHHGVVRLSDRCPRTRLLDSAYYNEFLRTVRIRHVFGLMVRPEFDPSRIVVLGFHRPPGEPDFSATELGQAAALAPAFHASVERMCYRSRITQAARTRGPAAAATIRCRVLQFAPDARLLGAAASVTATEFPYTSGTLCFPALRDALRAASGGTAPAVIADARWKSLLADVGLCDVEPGDRLCIARASAGAGERFELEIRAPAAWPHLESWAQGIRLTPREYEVAGQIARGLRNAQVGDRLGLSLKTVENHLRSIYAKAGVQSRSQLLSQLLGRDARVAQGPS